METGKRILLVSTWNLLVFLAAWTCVTRQRKEESEAHWGVKHTEGLELHWSAVNNPYLLPAIMKWHRSIQFRKNFAFYKEYPWLQLTVKVCSYYTSSYANAAGYLQKFSVLLGCEVEWTHPWPTVMLLMTRLLLLQFFSSMFLFLSQQSPRKLGRSS